MSNLPKIGDTIKTGTLEEIKAIEGVYETEDGMIKHRERIGYLSVYDNNLLGKSMIVDEEVTEAEDYIYLDGEDGSMEYPKWAYEAILSKPTKQPKQPKKSPLETERDQLEARLAEVKEGVRLESEIKTDATNLKAKRARLAEIKKNGGK